MFVGSESIFLTEHFELDTATTPTNHQCLLALLSGNLLSGNPLSLDLGVGVDIHVFPVISSLLEWHVVYVPRIVSADLKGSQFGRFRWEPVRLPAAAGHTNASTAV
jgi:hypothetical protein